MTSQAINNPCQAEINALNTVRKHLEQQKGNIASNIQASSISRDNNMVNFWEDKLYQNRLYINAVEGRISYSTANCTRYSSNYNGGKSSYTPSSAEMADIYGQCGYMHPDDEGAYKECVANAVKDLGGESDSGSGQSGKFMTTVHEIMGWLTGGGGSTTANNIPPTPPSNNLILGMTPSIAIPVGLLAGGLLVWGVVALVNHKSK